jgi:TadE-like protein
MTRLRLRRRRQRGQSLVEMSLIAPALVALAAGCGQVGIIAYGGASVESSARAAARVAAEYPSRSLDFVSALGTSTYTCGQNPTNDSTEQSVCAAARSASGLLSGSALTITITSTATITRVPDDVVRVAQTSCTGSALETGTVSRLPTGTVATISSPATATGSVLSSSTGAYSICLAPPTKTVGTQITSLTATAVDAQGCTYSTSMSVTVTWKSVVTPSPANMSLPTTGVCPTAQASPTPTPTPTATATATPNAWQGGALPTPPPAAACSPTISDTSFVQVTVSYRAPVFVPIVGKYFESPAGSGGRTVSATQRMQVEPCAVTQGG